MKERRASARLFHVRSRGIVGLHGGTGGVIPQRGTCVGGRRAKKLISRASHKPRSLATLGMTPLKLPVLRPFMHRKRIRIGHPNSYDFGALLSFLAKRSIPGVEIVDGETYRRTISINGADGYLCVFRRGTAFLEIAFSPHLAGDAEAIAQRVRMMFDLDCDPAAVSAVLGRDPLLRAILRRHPGVRIPGAWDPFELAVRAIVGQQVSVAGARTLIGRIAAELGTTIDTPFPELGLLFPSPSRIAHATIRGMPAARAATISRVAAAGVRSIEQLMNIDGIGPWTAHYIAMRALDDRDAFPASDLGLRKAANGMSARELDRRSEAWRPYRSYAAILLWSSL